jgi:hypothetical protein
MDARGAVQMERGWSVSLYLVGGWLAEVRTEGGGHPKGAAGPSVVGLRLVGEGTVLLTSPRYQTVKSIQYGADIGGLSSSIGRNQSNITRVLRKTDSV